MTFQAYIKMAILMYLFPYRFLLDLANIRKRRKTSYIKRWKLHPQNSLNKHSTRRTNSLSKIIVFLDGRCNVRIEFSIKKNLSNTVLSIKNIKHRRHLVYCYSEKHRFTKMIFIDGSRFDLVSNSPESSLRKSIEEIIFGLFFPFYNDE